MGFSFVEKEKLASFLTGVFLFRFFLVLFFVRFVHISFSLVKYVVLSTQMPRKVRELIKDLIDAGFIEKGGKGSHRKLTHERVTKFVVLSGHLGDDARDYQEQAIRVAIKESQK